MPLTVTEKESRKDSHAMLSTHDEKMKKKAALADAAITEEGAEDVRQAHSPERGHCLLDYYAKTGLSSSLGACIATVASSAEAGAAATTYDVSVFFSDAEVDDRR